MAFDLGRILRSSPEAVGGGKLPPRAWFFHFSDEAEARRGGEGTLRLLLDGEWEFRFFSSPDEVNGDHLPGAAGAWEKITVPGCWDMQGYGHPHYTNIVMPFDELPPDPPKKNPTGVYRRNFRIPEEWLRPIGRKLVLSPTIVGIEPPATLDDFVDQLLELGGRVRPRTAPDDPAPDFRKFAIEAECALFNRWIRYDDRKSPPVWPAERVTRIFPGANGSIEAGEVPLNALYLMKFRFHLEEPRRVRVIFCTRSLSRVWVDEVFAFGRDGGWMSPSYSTVPLNQFVDAEVEAGIHTLVVGVAPTEPDENIYWVMGIASCSDRQWLPYTFFDNEEEV